MIISKSLGTELFDIVFALIHVDSICMLDPGGAFVKWCQPLVSFKPHTNEIVNQNLSRQGTDVTVKDIVQSF